MPPHLRLQGDGSDLDLEVTVIGGDLSRCTWHLITRLGDLLMFPDDVDALVVNLTSSISDVMEWNGELRDLTDQHDHADEIRSFLLAYSGTERCLFYCALSDGRRFIGHGDAAAWSAIRAIL